MKKSVSFAVEDHSQSDVISLDAEPLLYAPDSISPSPIPGYTRFKSSKYCAGNENAPPAAPQHTPIAKQSLEFTSQIPSKSILPTSKVNRSPSTTKSQSDCSIIKSQQKVCPKVEILAETTLADNVRAMTQKSDELYNSKLRRSRVSTVTPDADLPFGHSGLGSHVQNGTQLFSTRDTSTVSRIPVYGPRRFSKLSQMYKGDSGTHTNKFQVTKSEVENYEIICKLASSRYQSEDAVNLSGVRCTFWSLGESLKPGGLVKTFVVSAFCYSLFQKPNGHPDASKRHYFFSNISENLLKDIDEADQDVLARAFRRSSKARPLQRPDMLFFPTCFEDNWFVFVVDMKDRKYVMLDPLYNENDEFQEVVRERMRASFQYHWDKYVQADMDFSEYDFYYPLVPKLPTDNNTDSGIYAMMFIEHCMSPTSLLTSVFTPQDIANIRIKIANDLVFQPKNVGMKQRIIEYNLQDM
ncbi:unnamed protein product [Urochloa decumbens]|uniref:Ubiquitin-like protease family profile domain-containing protein n=1 Tax=Urochloa decumbens TaxID=240449 RepID=A0ABC8Z9W7_9POAL